MNQNFVNRVNGSIQKRMAIALTKLKGYNALDNHYIFADPRGGSTWLMEIIQTITNDPVIWEPLHLGLHKNPFKDINFGWRQHIPEEENWIEAKELFDELFSGNILNESILHHSSFSQILISKSLLFKICRGSALLPWLAKNYSFTYKPIFLIRHPFAIVSSQLKHGAWDYPFTSYTIPNTAHNDIYLKHKDFLKTLTTKEEELTAEWCLANQETLSHPNNNINWITINYEDFVLNPKKSINRILRSWEMNYDLSTINFDKDSKTTRESSPDSSIERMSNWQKQFNKKQIDEMGRVLDYFKVETYVKNDFMPKVIYE